MKLKRRLLVPYLYIAPAFIYLFILWVFPFLYSLILSFQKWELASLDTQKKFVGFKNYVEIVKDPEFWNGINRTLVYVFSAVGFEFVAGFGIALLVCKQLRGMGVFRRFILIPFLVAPVVVGLMWMWMYNPELGIVNHFIRTLEIHDRGFTWTGDPSMAMFSVVLADIWQWTPFVILLFVAGIVSLPPDPFDAARIDGASRWQIFKYITLPMLKPVMMVILLIRTMTAFKFIDKIFVLTHGGPASTTEVLGFYIYRVSFMHFRMGYGAALSYVMFIIVIALCFIVIRFLRVR